MTNNIRSKVIFENDIGWHEEELTNTEIIEALQKEHYKGFLSFSTGVYVTSYARINLLRNLIKLDKQLVYTDTDSLKITEGFDINIINDYNKKVIEKIKKVCSDLNLPFEAFSPKDKKGVAHTIGLLEEDSRYYEFKTMGAKKYAYTKWVNIDKIKNIENVNIIKKEGNKVLILEITVSGVPKNGAKALKSLEDFKDDFIFDYKYTNKHLLCYNDNQDKFLLTDYLGNKLEVVDKYGIALLPTTYELGKSYEYSELLSDYSSPRAIYRKET